MKNPISSSIVLFSLILFGAAQAQRRVEVYRVYYGTPYVHEGFYFSLSPGISSGNFEQDNYDGTDKLKITGGSSNIDVKIGGTVARNLILSGDLIGSSMLWPDVKIGKVDYGRDNAELRQGLLGLGLTYYIMPANVFLSGTLGVGGFSYTTPSSEYQSDRGLGFQVKVGKEWWVSPKWGVGLSVFFLNQHVNDPYNQDLNGGFLGVLLNTSFN